MILERGRQTRRLSGPLAFCPKASSGFSHRDGSTKQGAVPSLVEEAGMGVWEGRGAGSCRKDSRGGGGAGGAGYAVESSINPRRNCLESLPLYRVLVH